MFVKFGENKTEAPFTALNKFFNKAKISKGDVRD